MAVRSVFGVFQPPALFTYRSNQLAVNNLVRNTDLWVLAVNKVTPFHSRPSFCIIIDR
mgnify:CR=1 FL=1